MELMTMVIFALLLAVVGATKIKTIYLNLTYFYVMYFAEQIFINGLTDNGNTIIPAFSDTSFILFVISFMFAVLAMFYTWGNER